MKNERHKNNLVMKSRRNSALMHVQFVVLKFVIFVTWIKKCSYKQKKTSDLLSEAEARLNPTLQLSHLYGAPSAKHFTLDALVAYTLVFVFSYLSTSFKTRQW